LAMQLAGGVGISACVTTVLIGLDASDLQDLPAAAVLFGTGVAALLAAPSRSEDDTRRSKRRPR